MADPVYKMCAICGASTKHSAVFSFKAFKFPSKWPLCRSTFCREIALGKEAAERDSVAYLTEPQSREQP